MCPKFCMSDWSSLIASLPVFHADARTFNQNLDSWDVSKVTTLLETFYGEFNLICMLLLSSIHDLQSLLENCLCRRTSLQRGSRLMGCFLCFHFETNILWWVHFGLHSCLLFLAQTLVSSCDACVLSHHSLQPGSELMGCLQGYWDVANIWEISHIQHGKGITLVLNHLSFCCWEIFWNVLS